VSDKIVDAYHLDHRKVPSFLQIAANIMTTAAAATGTAAGAPEEQGMVAEQSFHTILAAG
jgi:hypothetical protein